MTMGRRPQACAYRLTACAPGTAGHRSAGLAACTPLSLHENVRTMAMSPLHRRPAFQRTATVLVSMFAESVDKAWIGDAETRLLRNGLG